MDIRLSEDQHYYIVDGVKYVRATYAMSKIPKPWLDRWRVNVGEDEADRIRDETAIIGDIIHKMTELYDLGLVDKVKWLIKQHPWLLPYFVAWKIWTQDRIEKWVWIERLVYHRSLLVGGRIDRMGIFKGDISPSIVDIKSTKSLSATMGIQLYLYRAMAVDTIYREALPTDLIPTRTVIAHLPGPRWENGVDKTEFQKVVVKEFEYKKFQNTAIDCVNEFYAMVT
jgi:hypothetical protein